MVIWNTILNCLKTKSTEGISFPAQSQELYMAILSLAYNYNIKLSIDQYAEGIVAAAQTVILILLIWKFGKWGFAKVMPHVLLFLATAFACFNFPEVLKLAGLEKASVFNLPINTEILTVISSLFLISARATQILANIKQGGMGNLSISQPIVLLAGAAMRIYTLTHPGEGNSIMWGALAPFIASAVLTLISLMQFLYYGKSDPAKKSK
jgi:hypothetical protein